LPSKRKVLQYRYIEKIVFLKIKMKRLLTIYTQAV